MQHKNWDAGLCFVSILAVSAMGASSAFAGKHNPEYRQCQEQAAAHWRFKDKQCKEESPEGNTGKFEEVAPPVGGSALEAEQNGSLKFTINSAGEGFVWVCLKVKANGARIFSGEDTEVENLAKEKFRAGGKDAANSLEYKECSVEVFPKCKVRGPGDPFGTIKTKGLNSNLVFETKKAAEEEKQAEHGLVLFKPKTGKVLAELEFMVVEKAVDCPKFLESFIGKEKPVMKEPVALLISGEVLAKIVGNAETHAEIHEIEAGGKKEYWINNGGEQTERKTKKLELSMFAELELTGKMKLKLASKEDWQEFN